MKNIHYDGEHYFAAANSAMGFKSFFDSVFNEDTCQRIYILKGGPGSGKSTFMKKAALRCEENGLCVIYFHCSSDANSLDGILIKETKTAIIDGTSPHCFEPSLAGAFEVIVDLGTAWDIEALRLKKDCLKDLCVKKRACYADAYSNLEAHKRINDILHSLCRPFYNILKAEGCAKRLVKSITKGKKSSSAKSSIRLTNAMSCSGKIHLCSFEDMANTAIFIKDMKDTALFSHKFLSTVYQIAKENGIELLVSLNPADTSLIDGLYFVKEKVSVTIYSKEITDTFDKSAKPCRIINLCRFFDIRAMSKTKRERKFYKALADSLEEKALICLKNAGTVHFLLEDAYHSHTDYSKIEKITDNFCQNLFTSQTPHQ